MISFTDEHLGTEWQEDSHIQERISEQSLEEKVMQLISTVKMNTFAAAKRLLLADAMQKANNFKPDAAKIIGISLKTLYNWLNKFEEEDAAEQRLKASASAANAA